MLARGFEPLPFDADCARVSGRIRATLERTGASLGPPDTLIAAQAVVRNLVLVTGKLREFRRVPGAAVRELATLTAGAMLALTALEAVASASSTDPCQYTAPL